MEGSWAHRAARRRATRGAGRRTMRLAPLVLMALGGIGLFIGCSQSNGGQACQTDNDCPGTQICDPTTNTCMNSGGGVGGVGGVLNNGGGGTQLASGPSGDQGPSGPTGSSNPSGPSGTPASAGSTSGGGGAGGVGCRPPASAATGDEAGSSGTQSGTSGGGNGSSGTQSGGPSGTQSSGTQSS